MQMSENRYPIKFYNIFSLICFEDRLFNLRGRYNATPPLSILLYIFKTHVCDFKCSANLMKNEQYVIMRKNNILTSDRLG